MTEKFDVIVVGAGPAGNAAAYTLAKQGASVLQIERGEYAGSKNVQGAILYANAVEEVFPDFRKTAPLERHIIEQRVWVLDDTSYIGAQYRSDDFNEENPNRYTIIRAQFDKWASRQVREAGALVICDTTVEELIVEDGAVKGVRTEREDGEIFADLVILADGVNSLLAKKAGLRGRIEPEHVALAVKEMHFLPSDVIEQRFNIKGDEGVVIEIAGTVTEGMMGTAFIYTNKESLSVGIGCLVSDFRDSGIAPYDLLEKLKKHPSVAPLLAGSEVKEYAAHLIPEGGLKAIPKVYGAGWLMVGDSAGFVNAVHREGSNMALTTGRIAAETYLALKAENKPMTVKNLKRYRKTLDKTFVVKDLKKYKNMPEIFDRNRQFFTTYPELLSGAAKHILRVDGQCKKSKIKDITASFRKARSTWGLIGDAFKLVRAFR